MERRKFGKTALASIPIVVASGVSAQSFGVPASLTGGELPVPKDGKLTFPLDDSFVPPGLRDVNRSIMALYNNTASDPELSSEISRDPAGVLRQYGLAAYLDENDALFDAVKLATDDDLHRLMAQADYHSFMAELKSKGIVSPLRKSKLRKHYTDILSKDQESFTKYMKVIFDKNPATIPSGAARTERINRIVDLLQAGRGNKPLITTQASLADNGESNPEFVVAVVALVYIGVGAVTYAAVLSQVGVLLNVAVVATAVTYVALWAGGGGGPIPVDPGTQPGTQKAGMDGAVAENVRNMQRAAFAANFFGRKDLAVEAVKKVIDTELVAMIEAAEELGLIKMPGRARKHVLAELKKLCHDAVGIGA